MPNLLILTLNFSPDGVSTASLVSELADELRGKGHHVEIITTIPHANVDAEARAGQPLTRHWAGLIYRSTYHGLRVWHTHVTRKGQSALGRIAGYLLFNLTSLLVGIFGTGATDIVLVVSPPLTSGVIGWLLAKVKRARFIYNVQELYPDVFVNLKRLKPLSFSARLLYRIEVWVYHHADMLTVICEVFRRSIVAKGIAPGKIRLIPNFADTKALYPAAKANPLAAELGLTDCYVVLYAGNIGMTQSFETILDAADRLRNQTEIRFLIVGGGVRRAYVAEQIVRRSLTNVLLLPYQTYSRVLDLYATSDVNLVPLMAGMSQTTFPSKLYTIMASGRPVIAAVDMASDVIETVQKAQCGIYIAPDNALALETAILAAYADPVTFRAYGQRGRAYVEQHYSREQVGELYNQLVNDLLKGR